MRLFAYLLEFTARGPLIRVFLRRLCGHQYDYRYTRGARQLITREMAAQLARDVPITWLNHDPAFCEMKHSRCF